MPALNRIGAVASTRHMNIKLPSLEGVVITIKSEQKEAKKCYENNLKMKRGLFSVTTRPLREDGVTCVCCRWMLPLQDKVFDEAKCVIFLSVCILL